MGSREKKSWYVCKEMLLSWVRGEGTQGPDLLNLHHFLFHTTPWMTPQGEVHHHLLPFLYVDNPLPQQDCDAVRVHSSLCTGPITAPAVAVLHSYRLE